MTIEKIKDASDLTIKLIGRLDIITAPELEAEIKVCLSGIKTLTFDLAEVDYVSSAGLRTLLMAQKTMNKQGSMKFINVCEEVYEIFDITGFTDVFTIE